MSFLLGDITIGDYPLTQDFGANPQEYSALFNIRGHNGIDIACPKLTPIVAANDGVVQFIGSDKYGTFDSGGFGNYILLRHDGYLTLYAHLNDIAIDKDQRVIRGQLLGHSGNTGFSTGKAGGYHLHFGVAPCDANGVKTERDNGYSGYINPNDKARCHWDIKNITEPARPAAEELPPLSVPQADFVRMVTEGANGKLILTNLVDKDLNGWLGRAGFALVDLNRPDPKDGERANMYISAMYQELADLKIRPQNAPQPDVAAAVDSLPSEKKSSLLKDLVTKVWGTIWVTKQ